MGLFFEKTSNQSKFQRMLTNVIVIYLLISFSNSFIFKFEQLNSVIDSIGIVLLAVVFIWLIFYVSINRKGK